MLGIILSDLQRSSTGDQADPNLAAARLVCGKRYRFAVGRNCREFLETNKIREALESNRSGWHRERFAVKNQPAREAGHEQQSGQQTQQPCPEMDTRSTTFPWDFVGGRFRLERRGYFGRRVRGQLH